MLIIRFTAALVLTACGLVANAGETADGAVIKRVLDGWRVGTNILNASAWRPYETGFAKTNDLFVCDNGAAAGRRGVCQYVELNQKTPQPFVASAWSRAENVSGERDSDYALYVDLRFADGTPMWGQSANFATGTHDFERREVMVLPDKPVKSVWFYLLLREHSGQASFRDAELRTVAAPAGSCLFDTVPVSPASNLNEKFQIRDVAAGSDFVRIEREALGVNLESKRSGDSFDVTLTDTTGKDRAITLVYSIPVTGGGWKWLANPRHSETAAGNREYVVAHPQPAGMGRLSRYPFAAISDGARGLGIGMDMNHPAFFRVGFNAGTHELFLAYDIGLTPEKPNAQIRFRKFTFDSAGAFRAALAKYYALFPQDFGCRTPEQGIWMPFAKISALTNWQDFGFKFKEGNDETKWDGEHGILTFRYTEPMTWWMRMPKEIPRTIDAAMAEAKELAEKGSAGAQAFVTSGFRDEAGRPPAQMLNTPWCDGAVWSMNSMPGIAGEITDFKIKWNVSLRDRLYGPQRKTGLDGEYVDSSEGYVTDILDYRRDHFAAADTPLTFSPDSHRPAIYRGLIAFEYVRGIARDIHAMNKLMMANATPSSLCWLAPNLDVMGTETDWNPGGQWRPMSDEELLYCRAICRGKPYCFLMNTDFTKLSHERVEKYMERCLAYGMFPGFFSADAATGHYFEQPELFERDRPLFKKYVPLCKLVAEAGWEPVTRARTSEETIHLERFGENYLTVFNDSAEPHEATITVDDTPSEASRDLVSGMAVKWQNKSAAIMLEGESVAVIQLR
ncbi:MAG: hypothetical protein ABSG59_15760 [Verrucomicrobiota bacterium]|jgi:hypothetical protein